MNHYPHHIGDFAKKTKMLSTTTSGAYRELLDVYYTDEKPLPLDLVDLYAMAKAKTPAERKAVDHVLGRFFEKGADGYHNKRADEEIAAYKAKSAKARESAEKRWSYTDRNANASATAMRTHSEGNAGLAMLTRTRTRTKAKGKTEKVEALSGSVLPNSDDAPEAINGHKPKLSDQAFAVLAFLNEKTGKHYRKSKATLTPIVARLRDGHSVRECKAVIARKCREWQDDQKMHRYLRPKTLFSPENFANYVGEVPPQENAPPLS